EMEKRTTTGAMLRVNGTYSGIGTIGIKDHGEVEGYISGIDLSNYEAVPDNIGTRFFYTGSLFPALKDAIANGDTEFNMRDRGTVIFTESIKLPNTMSLHAKGTEIVIPDGVTLTVENYCRVGTLTVQPGGHVTVSDVGGAQLRVDDALNYNNVNQFTVNRYMEIGLSAWRRDLENLNFGERGGLTVSSWAYNDSELAAALAGKPELQNDKIRNRIGIRYDCTLADDLIVDDFNLAVEDSGSLTIPAGKTLVCLNKVEAQDGPIYLQGRMISVGYGQLSLQWKNSAAALLNISGEGFYAGKEIHVHAPMDRRDACISGLDMSKVGKIINPDFTAYFPSIEVVLPDGLTALGGEAFANDSFHTVYIPSGITSIAPDAFSGTDVAIIFGVVGSYAEEYAADSGIPFLRLPDWYDVHDQQFVIDHTA
ncbi:MAG: leucine-rich repeat domain-containing protein, partial [Oscillospiraceae bacterium]|nr:leucine-rich repeat domain-containing protein [Oscillospiraceae bacterium]